MPTTLYRQNDDTFLVVTIRNISMRLELPSHGVFYMNLSRVETLMGMNSNAGDGRHFVFMDCDSVRLNELAVNLLELQNDFDLGEMYVTSDTSGNYRVWCFEKVDFRTLIQIIAKCPYTDIDFLRWTARKGCATMRLSTKAGRKPQEVVLTVMGRENPIPPNVELVRYETPQGKSVKLGVKRYEL
jgi:hypothetical protein